MSECVPVIVLADLSHSNESCCVFIGPVRVNVVQGSGIPGVPIASSEVNPHSEVDLTTSHYVVQE